MEDLEELTPEHPCYTFSKPDEVKMEFYSPGYQNSTYPRCIDCILILEGKWAFALQRKTMFYRYCYYYYCLIGYVIMVM